MQTHEESTALKTLPHASANWHGDCDPTQVIGVCSSASQGPSGVFRMRSLPHSRNSIPFHNSRRRPNWASSWKPGSPSRSSTRGRRPAGPSPQVIPLCFRSEESPSCSHLGELSPGQSALSTSLAVQASRRRPLQHLQSSPRAHHTLRTLEGDLSHRSAETLSLTSFPQHSGRSGRLDRSHPPPSASISSTAPAMRRPRMLTAVTSSDSAAFCAVITSR